MADVKWTEAAQFRRGDLVRYQIVVSASGDATIEVRMRVADQGGHVIFDGHGNLAVTPKAGSVYVQGTIPADAPAGNYTETATVTYNGATTTGFAVVAPDDTSQVLQLTKMFLEVATTLNTVCVLLECREIPPDISGSISKIGKVPTVANLGIAAARAFVVSNDLSALAQETKGHVRGAPLSTKTRELAIKTWNDNRQLHLTLVGLVPGLEQFFPVPSPK